MPHGSHRKTSNDPCRQANRAVWVAAMWVDFVGAGCSISGMLPIVFVVTVAGMAEVRTRVKHETEASPNATRGACPTHGYTHFYADYLCRTLGLQRGR